MDEHSSDHGDHEDHGIHLPDPSFWPFVAGIASFAVALALVWWARDRSNQIAGPLLGASGLLTLISAFGWAYEDGRMKKKAEEGSLIKAREARFTQVVTFAVAEGRLAASRAAGGILAALDSSDGALRDLAGFQDLRIIASPAETGPSQVLVETTWSNREGLASYEETRRTLLDSVAAHPDDVVPGSVQVFDMEVVRDTKEMAFRFGMGPAVAIFGSLVVFGLMVGAGLTIFAHDGKAAASLEPGTGPAPVAGNVVTATDNKLDKATLEAPPNSSVTFEFKNAGKVKHNLHFLDKAGGATLAPGGEGKIIDGGQSEPINFKTPAAGSYYFQCDLHPDQMKGTFTVKDGASAPGGAGGGQTASGGTGSPPGGSGADVVATDDKFNKTSLDVAANSSISVSFKNNGASAHNLHFLDKKDGNSLAPGAEGKIINGGQSETITFTPPAAGKYYFQCDVHPDRMFGSLNVT
ncbi:MAG: cupredoxin domain-containing protein [Anaerolineaceae bacterium]